MATYCPYCMSSVSPGQACPNCGANPANYHSSSHHFPMGQLLHDRYLVGKVLGEGGFGITYLGKDTTLERRVAIKEYFPSVFVQRESATSLSVTCYAGEKRALYEKGRGQFLKEAQVMAQLGAYSEIVQVHDFFAANNTAYIVMELLTGNTLRALLAQQERIPAKSLFEMMEPLLCTMNAVHCAGIIHRDISPDNIMLMDNGQVKLLDFGCARNVDKDHTMTVMLKHGYAPIEQYTGYNQGPWTDIYALCATFYRCLTGQTPPRALERITQDPLIPPNRLGAALNPEQEEALMRGLAMEPKNRWQSVAGLYAALYGTVIKSQHIAEPKPEPEHEPEPQPQSGLESIPNPAPIPASITEPKQKTAPFFRNSKYETKPNKEAKLKPVPIQEPESDETKKHSYLERINALPKAVKGGAVAVACLIIVLGFAAGSGVFSGGSQSPVAPEDGVPAQNAETIQNTLEGSVTTQPPAPEHNTTVEGAPTIEDAVPAEEPEPTAAPEVAAPSQEPGQDAAPVSGAQVADETSAADKPKPTAPLDEPQDMPTPTSDSDFTIEDGVLTKYTGAGGAVVIPDGVTTIGWNAFYGCDSLTSVTIPNSITDIWSYAFYGCRNLTNVTIPNGVIGIREAAFNRCYSLTSVTISDSVTIIGSAAFYYCDSLTSVTIPNSVTSIGGRAFEYCKSLTDVYYDGSESQWKQIDISHNNDPLLNATIHYSS